MSSYATAFRNGLESGGWVVRVRSEAIADMFHVCFRRARNREADAFVRKVEKLRGEWDATIEAQRVPSGDYRRWRPANHGVTRMTTRR
jgi:hypothetical protein